MEGEQMKVRLAELAVTHSNKCRMTKMTLAEQAHYVCDIVYRLYRLIETAPSDLGGYVTYTLPADFLKFNGESKGKVIHEIAEHFKKYHTGNYDFATLRTGTLMVSIHR